MTANGRRFGFFMLLTALLLSASANAQVPPGGKYVNKDLLNPHLSAAPAKGSLGGLHAVSKQQWGEREVRLVLQTFAYGGQASDQQIAAWANMAPNTAITQMLNFDPVNLRLSPQGADDPSTQFCDSLESLQEFWGSNDAANPMRADNRPQYATLNANNQVVGPTHLYMTWSRLMHTPGCNRFLHKMAFYLTNYHASIHIQNAGPTLMRSYYDDTVQGLAGGGSFVDMMNLAASHAAVSFAYGHRSNRFNLRGEFFGNDDFAREYFQLLFGIEGTTEDEEYHEDVTIEHNAWLLTGMAVDLQPDAWGSTLRRDWWVAPIDFSNHLDGAGRLVANQSIHFTSSPRDEQCLEILHQQICGLNAQDKLMALGPVAASHPESMASVPLKLIRFFGDDRLSPDEITDLQSAWAAANFDLLRFIRAYAISTQFLAGDAVKLRSAFDRNLAIHNLNQLSAEEAYAEPFRTGPTGRMSDQGAVVFAPIRDVFGGQTGNDAANDRYVFKNAWDANVTNPQFLATPSQAYTLAPDGPELLWIKDWGSAIPGNPQGLHLVAGVADWLWNHFIGDGGANFDPIARAQVYSLLAAGMDFGALISPDNPQVRFSSAEVTSGLAGEFFNTLAIQSMNFDTMAANQRVGMAINFITALPYTYATGAAQ